MMTIVLAPVHILHHLILITISMMGVFYFSYGKSVAKITQLIKYLNQDSNPDLIWH